MLEHWPDFDDARERVNDTAGFDLEQQLASAERQYALARARARRARDECHALEAEDVARAEVIRMARERSDAAEQKCVRLRRLIEELEDQLGG